VFEGVSPDKIVLVPIGAKSRPLDERAQALGLAVVTAHRVGVQTQREAASVCPSWLMT